MFFPDFRKVRIISTRANETEKMTSTDPVLSYTFDWVLNGWLKEKFSKTSDTLCKSERPTGL